MWRTYLECDNYVSGGAIKTANHSQAERATEDDIVGVVSQTSVGDVSKVGAARYGT